MSFGDSTIVPTIKSKTSWVYQNKDITHFLLTKRQFRKAKTHGTNIIAHFKNDSINRIIATSTGKKGQFAAEYYFHHGQLIFSYQTFEEFEPSGSWENFKGLKGYESRYYFLGGKLKYHVHRGLSEHELKPGQYVLDVAYELLDHASKLIKE